MILGARKRKHPIRENDTENKVGDELIENASVLEIDPLAELNDKYLRTLAEYDNFRKRTIKERENESINAQISVLKQMLPILDNLQRASKSAEDSSDLGLKTGVEMITKILDDNLKQLGVTPIDCSEFNPEYHNAIMHIEDEALGENAIVDVFETGYMFKGKILRCSTVKVAN